MKQKIDVVDIGKEEYNILLFSTIISIIFFFILYTTLNGFSFEIKSIKIIIINIIIYFISIIFLGFMHEMTHAVFLVVLGKGKREHIKFGIMWKVLTPYVHYAKGIKLKAYITSAIIPVIYGIVPIVTGLVLKNSLIYIIGVTMFLGSYGDLLIVWTLKDIPKNAIVKDHPEKVGCEVYLIK